MERKHQSKQYTAVTRHSILTVFNSLYSQLDNSEFDSSEFSTSLASCSAFCCTFDECKIRFLSTTCTCTCYIQKNIY